MEQAGTLLGTLIFFAILVAPVWQLFSVPYQARKRGKDPGVWFVLCAIWLVLFFGLSWLGYLLLLSAVMQAALGWGLESWAVTVLGGVVLLLVEFTPTFAVRAGSTGMRPPARPYRKRYGARRRRKIRRIT